MPEDDSTRQNGNQPEDPIADRSLSGPILAFSVVLFLTLVWAMADELFIERPWKSYQQRFVATTFGRCPTLARSACSRRRLLVRQNRPRQALDLSAGRDVHAHCPGLEKPRSRRRVARAHERHRRGIGRGEGVDRPRHGNAARGHRHRRDHHAVTNEPRERIRRHQELRHRTSTRSRYPRRSRPTSCGTL